jgi:hypothetical protein
MGMKTTRRREMPNKTTHRGVALNPIRLLGGVAATLALVLVLGAGTASARTVYDYVYSGTYIDGSGAGKAFDEGLGGLAFDGDHSQLLAIDDGSPGFISKLDLAGQGIDFSGLGSPRISLEPGYREFGQNFAQVTVDESGGPNEGNVYANINPYRFGFGADGTVLPGVLESNENLCGITVTPDGEELLVETRFSTEHFTVAGKPLFIDRVSEPGYETGIRKNWSERGRVCKPVVDNEGNIYGITTDKSPTADGSIAKLNPRSLEQYEINVGGGSAAVAIDHSNDDVFVVKNSGRFESYDDEGHLLGYGWGGPDPARSYAGLNEGRGIAVDPQTHDVWVSNSRSYSGVRRVEKFERTNPHVIPDTTAITPDYSNPTGETIVLRGNLNPDGVAVTNCHFEYGKTQDLGTSVPCAQGNSFSGSTDQVVTTAPISVTKGTRYFYKLFANNGDEQVSASNLQRFFPQGKAEVGVTVVDRVKTDGARLRTEFNPNGGNASVHFIYGVKGGPLDQTTPESPVFGFDTNPGQFEGENTYRPGVYPVSMLINGLQRGTAYEYEAVVSNEAGSTVTEPAEFITYLADAGSDSCPNALPRQQTGSSLVLDCRAYELVSPADAGGFDVESDVVAGQSPLDAYPRADDRLLFSMHFGVVPGVAGSPTNLGLDPYVAHWSAADGWTTEYVGIPADGMADEGSFGSPLYGADPTLHEFAFGGNDICDPCYEDGSTNIPLRLADNELVKGISGSLNPPADPSGTVRKAFSADGSHFVFGTDAVVEPGGDPQGSIYPPGRPRSSPPCPTGRR